MSVLIKLLSNDLQSLFSVLYQVDWRDERLEWGLKQGYSIQREHSMLPEAEKTGLDKLKAQGESHSKIKKKKKAGNLHYFYYTTNSARVQVT